MKNEIIFKLNSGEKIVILLKDALKDIRCCYFDFDILLIENNHYYNLSNSIDSLRVSLENLQSLLTLAFQNKLSLHKAFQHIDIGYMYNEYKLSQPSVIYETPEGSKFKSWIGDKYLLWGNELILWIYNNDLGEIILEVTPPFPGESIYLAPGEEMTEEDKKNLIRYHNWIKGYQPFLIQIIPREIAKQWIEQANNILKIIENNTKQGMRE